MATTFRYKNRFLLTLLAALTLLFGLTAPAHAHDELIKAVPEDKAELTTAPDEVTLTFSGNLTTGQGIPNVILVRDDNDQNWAEGEAEVDGRTISVGLKEGMPAGTYRVSYRVVYSDGHPEEKMYSFTLNTTDEAEQSASPSESPTSETTQQATEQATEEATETTEASEPATTGATSTAPEENDGNSGGMVAIWVGVAVAIAAGLGFFGKSRKNKRENTNP